MRRAQHSITRPGTFVHAAIKQAKHVLTYKVAYWLGEKHGKVYFYPETPHPYTAAYKALHLSGIRVVGGLPGKADKSPVIFIWEDSTFSRHPVPTVPNGAFVVNRDCRDISKSLVGQLHLEVFGYHAEIDPLSYMAQMVAKSEENGAHSGKIVTGPLLSKEPGWTYQRVINNTSDGLALFSAGAGKAIDFRVLIFGGVRQRAYIKFRDIRSRFGNVNDLVEFVDVDTLFSRSEIDKLNEFCKRIGLDYGEIDVVRDAGSNLIFVLDVNKTPLGPPNGLPKSGVADALSFYKESFSNFVTLRR